MAFTGFSSDEEGSIVFDGEQFIINNPENVPVDFNPHGRPVIGLPVTHPSHPQNQQPISPPDPVTGLMPFDTEPSVFHTAEYTRYGQPPSTEEEAERREQRIKKARQRFQDAKQRATSGPPSQPVDELPPDIAADEYIDSEPLPLSDSPDWPGSTPLSQGQDLHVDHLLSVEDDTMVREMLIGIKREGIPPKAFVYDFMAQYAEWGWDDLSSARALQVLEIVRNSDWDERLQQADSSPVETVAQDLADNTIEGLTVIDARTGRVLLNRTGVLGAGGQQYVGLQDYEVEALRGLELIFVHNHTKDVGASDDDLWSAFDAGAKLLIVITQNGREQVYIRGRGRMVLVRDEKASYEVGPGTAAEHALLEAKSWEQARAYLDDSPEHVFLQEDPEAIANMDVNSDEIPRYRELETFVNTSLAELQRLAEENPMVIDENIELLKNVFGYEIAFYDGDDLPADYYKEGSIEDKQSAMEQVHNLGTILFHFLNDLGFQIMQSTPEETIFVLGADERIRELHNVDDYAFRGHVALPESTAKGNPDLKIVYLGSEIEAGAIGHEVAHEIDRRMGNYGTVKVEYEEDSEQTILEVGPDGSLLWFFKNQVLNQQQRRKANDRYSFETAVTNLLTGSRAASEQEKDYLREIFADLLAAKLLGPLDEDFFSKHGALVQIGFRNTFGAADIAIAMEQYFDDYAKYLGDGDSPKPEEFEYIKYHDWQKYDELQWPVMPVQGDEE